MQAPPGCLAPSLELCREFSAPGTVFSHTRNIQDVVTWRPAGRPPHPNLKPPLKTNKHIPLLHNTFLLHVYVLYYSMSMF